MLTNKIEAAEAREITLKTKENKLTEIFSKIRTAAENGQNSVSTDEFFDNIIVNELRKLGYKLEKMGKYNEFSTLISWEEE